MKTTMKTTAAAMLISLAAHTAGQAALQIEQDFNTSNGTQSLVNRGTVSVTGAAVGNFTFSSIVPSVNSGGSSGSFDGAGDAVDMGNSVGAVSQLTITAWLRPVSLGANDRIVDKLTSTDGWTLAVSDNLTSLRFVGYQSGAGDTASSTANLTLNAWQFVAVTFDDATNTVRFYRGNGTALSADGVDTEFTKSFSANSANLYIGDRVALDRSFDGMLDNVRIYDTVLDSTELTSAMQFNDVVPEPSTWLLLGMSATVLVIFRRRRLS